MKKAAAFLLALCLLTGFALAEVDLSYVRESPNIFTVEDDDPELIYIYDTYSAEDLHFIHAHESDYRWSFTYFELAILDGEMPIYPMMRVIYNADDPLNLHAVSFDVDGTRYTFDVSDSVNTEKDEQSTTESAIIFFSSENFAFLNALTAVTDRYGTAEEMRTVRINAVLHGDEDLTVTLNENFLLDFWLVVEDAFKEMGGMSALDDVDLTTDMTVSEAPAPAETPEDPDDDSVTEDELTQKLLELLGK